MSPTKSRTLSLLPSAQARTCSSEMLAFLFLRGSEGLTGLFIRLEKPQNVCREGSRSQFHVVAGSLPGVRAAAQQIMRAERAIALEPQRCEIKIDKAGLLMPGIQIDDRENHVRTIFI